MNSNYNQYKPNDEDGGLDIDYMIKNELEMNSSHSSLNTSSNDFVSSDSESLVQQFSFYKCSIKNIFEAILRRHDFSIDSNSVTAKYVDLTKQLQRKLINLNQILSIPLDKIHKNNTTILNSVPTSPTSLLTASFNHTNLQSSTTSSSTTTIYGAELTEFEYKHIILRTLRSIVEQISIDMLFINQQNPNKIWTEMKDRGCQFLGPQMQEDVLHLILHALNVCELLRRKTLVEYLVLKLSKQYANASKTSVGHVVQLLYKAQCFYHEKNGEEKLMGIRPELSKYPQLRRQHDIQIISIGFEGGAAMPPEQWSHKLYGDPDHKSEMQSIVDKLKSQQTFRKVVDDLYKKFNSTVEKIKKGKGKQRKEQQENLINSSTAQSQHNEYAEMNLMKECIRLRDYFDLFLDLTRNDSPSISSPHTPTLAQQQQKLCKKSSTKCDLNNNNSLDLSDVSDMMSDCSPIDTTSSSSSNDEAVYNLNDNISLKYINWLNIYRCIGAFDCIMRVYIEHHKFYIEKQSSSNTKSMSPAVSSISQMPNFSLNMKNNQQKHNSDQPNSDLKSRSLYKQQFGATNNNNSFNRANNNRAFNPQQHQQTRQHQQQHLSFLDNNNNNNMIPSFGLSSQNMSFPNSNSNLYSLIQSNGFTSPSALFSPQNPKSFLQQVNQGQGQQKQQQNNITSQIFDFDSLGTDFNQIQSQNQNKRIPNAKNYQHSTSFNKSANQNC